MVPDLLINDYRSKPRNFLVFISLCVLLFCILVRMFLTKSSESSSNREETVREITRTITERTVELPKVEQLQPVLNTVENIDLTKVVTGKEENVNWALVLFGLFCILLLLACFYLVYLLYKSKHTSTTPEVADGDPLVALISDPVPAKPAAPVAAPAPAPTQAPENVATNQYQKTNVRVMDAPVTNNTGDLQINYEPAPLTLGYPPETIQDIRNAPAQTYTPDQQQTYIPEQQPQVYQPQVYQPQQQYYVQDRPMPFDYVSQEEPQRRNVAMYDTYNVYEQKSCALPPIDYDEIGCSNTRHGDHCQCENCV